MSEKPRNSVQITGDIAGSVLGTGPHKAIIHAEQVMQRAAEAAHKQGQEPTRMLRILAVLAAPVYDPTQPDHLPPPMDLLQEWHKLSESVCQSCAPILLSRLMPPTLDALRKALSPRAEIQDIFPQILHFSGHAWAGGLLLEDEFGQVHPVTTNKLLDALKGIPRPLDLVVLNGCETAADAARSVAQALVNAGLARAVVGHPLIVWDAEAVAFAGRLYAELANGFSLDKAVQWAQQAVTTHQVVLIGDKDLCFKDYLAPGKPVIEGGWSPPPKIRADHPSRFFFGRGKELVKLARILEYPPAVGVITGPSGIGKSALLLEAAHRNAWRFPGGIAFASGPRPEDKRPSTIVDLFTKLAATLGIEATPERVVEAVLEHTALKPTLLLLDNLESLPEVELAALGKSLRGLGSESAALLALRPPRSELEELPTAHPLPLHEGIGEEAAARYASVLAKGKNVPLELKEAWDIALATGGHPRLIELLLARARERDWKALLEEIRNLKGDFVAQLERVYAWSAERLDEAGRAAWRALLLFPAGMAPEKLLWVVASRQGAESLRDAALADFYPADQLWRWHGSVSDYARAHWPMAEEERRERQVALLEEWASWFEGLKEEAEDERHRRLEMNLANLEAELEAAKYAPKDTARKFFAALGFVLPPPDRTLALRPFLADFYRMWLERIPPEAEEAEKERAPVLGMLGFALSALGLREEALKATEEAVRIYRKLSEQNPQAFLPYLAGSLNNLGMMLSALGRREEALKATEEAVGIYRKLSELNPQAFLPYLAMSLNNLGNRLSELGRREEALKATEEAVKIRRKLSELNPQAFLPDLARSLGAHGSVLHGLGRHAEAAAAFAEGLRAILPFVRAIPAAFGGLAGALLEDYLRACKEAKREPDWGLVEEVRRLVGGD